MTTPTATESKAAATALVTDNSDERIGLLLSSLRDHQLRYTCTSINSHNLAQLAWQAAAQSGGKLASWKAKGLLLQLCRCESEAMTGKCKFTSRQHLTGACVVLADKWKTKGVEKGFFTIDAETSEIVVSRKDKPIEQDYADRMYAYAMMSVLYSSHNGNKEGVRGVYPQRKGQITNYVDGKEGGPALYQADKGLYNGHNIAAFAVDLRTNRIVACEFNHTTLQKSTASHAENRLIDYLFRHPERTGLPLDKHHKLLSNVCIVTSLQPCYQCAGKLLMAGVKRCIWLQPDDEIADEKRGDLFKLARDIALARDSKSTSYNVDAKPMSEVFALAHAKQHGRDAPNDEDKAASEKLFPYPQKLHAAYHEWARAIRNREVTFFNKTDGKVLPPADKPDSSSVPSFLCTDAALNLFKAGHEELLKEIVAHEEQTLTLKKVFLKDLHAAVENFSFERYYRGAHHT